MTKTEAVIRLIFGAVGRDLRPLVYAVDTAIELLFLQGVAMDDICAPRDMIFYLAYYVYLDTPFFTAVEQRPQLLF